MAQDLSSTNVDVYSRHTLSTTESV